MMNWATREESKLLNMKIKLPFKNSKSPSKESAKSDLKSSILAFRTITTMLSLIQRPTVRLSFETEGVDVPESLRNDLRVLDSVAALLVREDEKVAVMAKELDGKSFPVICVINRNDPGSTVPQTDTDSGAWPPARWIASLNSRFSKPVFPETKEDSMRVVDPDTRVSPTLSHHKEDLEMLLRTFLLTEW